MYVGDKDETDALFGALRDEGKQRRRQMEKTGGLLLVGVGVLFASVFLWALAVSLKRPLDLAMTAAGVAGGIAVFAWGLKMAIFGRWK